MTWDPDRYERFADHRLRPGLDLIERVGDFTPRRVVDLGCGTGRLTEMLARRFPDAAITGLDASAEMLPRGRPGLPNIEWIHGDIDTWRPDRSYGLIFSNAALHWIDDHPALFARLGAAVPPGGVLAVQMPDNWREPTHTVPAAILDTGEFGAEASRALVRNRVGTPGDYRTWLGHGLDVDLWTTTYHHVLGGSDPVLEWVRGSVLAPVVEALAASDRERFLGECAARYRAAYPPEPDGSTVLAFRRLFIVARRRR